MRHAAILPPVMQELSAAHALALECAARANRFLDRAASAGADQRAGLESVRMTALATRLMEGVGQGIERLRGLAAPGPNAAIDLAAGAHASAAASRVPATTRQVHPAVSAQGRLHATPGQRRGCLKNGNPAGDYLKSPRCGARTRAGCGCRQPAMANGRCRMHGGLSTGPRTPAGLARCRTTRLTHGYRSRELIGLRRRAMHAARRLRSLAHALSAGHGVHRSDPARNLPATVVRKQERRETFLRWARGPSPGFDHPPGRTDSEQRDHPHPPHTPCLRVQTSARAAGLSAGHGVHRSFRDRLRSSASAVAAGRARSTRSSAT